MSGYTAMQCSCPRVMTSPEASSSRNCAGKIRRDLSSSLGVQVPRTIGGLLHCRELAIRKSISSQRAPLYPTSPHPCTQIPPIPRHDLPSAQVSAVERGGGKSACGMSWSAGSSSELARTASTTAAEPGETAGHAPSDDAARAVGAVVEGRGG